MDGGVVCRGKKKKKCGFKLDSSMKFCTNCGKKVDPKLFLTKRKQATSPERKRKFPKENKNEHSNVVRDQTDLKNENDSKFELPSEKIDSNKNQNVSTDPNNNLADDSASKNITSKVEEFIIPVSSAADQNREINNLKENSFEDLFPNDNRQTDIDKSDLQKEVEKKNSADPNDVGVLKTPADITANLDLSNLSTNSNRSENKINFPKNDKKNSKKSCLEAVATNLEITAPKKIRNFDEEHHAKLESVKMFNDDIAIMSREAMLPKYKLIDREMPYEYFVKKDGEKIMELYQKKHGFKKRILKINKNDLTSECDQYDSIILKEKIKKDLPWYSKLYTKITRSNDFSNDVELSTNMSYHCHLPNWQDIKHEANTTGYGEQFLKTFSKVYACALKTYQELDIKDSLKPFLIDYVSGFNNNIYLKDQLLVNACCAVSVLNTCNLYKPEILSVLFRSLLLSVDSNKGTSNYELVCLHFPSGHSKEQLKLSLVEIIKIMNRFKNYNEDWLCILPLFHLLNGEVKPFEMKFNENHDDPNWWGIEKFQKFIDDFKLEHRSKLSWKQSLEHLQPLFEFDKLLPRSVLAVMNLHQVPEVIEMFPLDGSLANVYYFIRKIAYHNYTDQEIIIEALNNCLSVIKMSRMSNTLELNVQYWNCCFKLINKIYNYTPVGSIRLLSIQIMIALNNKQSSVDTSENANFQSLTLAVNDFLKISCPFVPYSSVNAQHFEIFSSLLTTQFSQQERQKIWSSQIYLFIKSYLGKMGDDVFFNFYSTWNMSEHWPKLCPIMDECALEKIEYYIQNYPFLLRNLLNNGDPHDKYKKIIETIMQKNWPVCEAPYYLMMFCVKSSIFPKFISIFYEKESIGILSNESLEKLIKCVSVIDSFANDIEEGNLSFSNLRNILIHERAFLNLYQLIHKEESNVDAQPADGHSKAFKNLYVSELFQLRKKELTLYENRLSKVKNLIEICQGIKSEAVDKLKNQLRILNDDTTMFNEILLPLTPSNVSSDPIFKKFIFNDQILNMIDTYSVQNKCRLFKRFWDEEMLKMSKRRADVDLDALVSEVLQPTLNFIDSLKQLIRSDKMLVKHVHQYFAFIKDVKSLEVELKTLFYDPSDGSLVDKRMKQIELYYQLLNFIRGAEVMIDIKNMFKLKGDFTDLQFVVELSTSQSMPLNNITEELVNSREVKVLVDLALISAEGQGDMEEQKVACLHTAVTGYSPLIYDLKEEMGFKEFYPVCMNVWKVLRADPNLPKKFLDTANDLEWLAKIKESHGSVEISALESASIINHKGVYTVGNINSDDDLQLDVENVIELSYYVERNKMDEKNIHKKFDMKQLCDLQSKLMLVAGKAQEKKDTVHNFVRAFDGVMRLANVYIDLLRAGCSLFKNWKIIFFCDPSIEENVIIEFGKDENELNFLKNLRSPGSNEKVLDKIEEVSDLMDTFLKDWLSYIENKRDKCHYLNYYTTKQLVILQRELAVIWKCFMNEEKFVKQKKDQPPDNCCHLLSLLKIDCGTADVNYAVIVSNKNKPEDEANLSTQEHSEDGNRSDERTEEVGSEENSGDESEDDAGENDKKDNDDDNNVAKERKKVFIEKMTCLGFPLELINEAVKHVGYEDSNQGLFWLADYKNRYDCETGVMKDSVTNDKRGPGENSNSTKKSSDPNIDLKGANSSDNEKKDEDNNKVMNSKGDGANSEKNKMQTTSVKSFMSDFFRNPSLSSQLEKNFKSLWEIFLKAIDSSYSDHLSIQQLGAVLAEIAKIGIDSSEMKRPCPRELKVGLPNLIVCDEGNIL
ncbi:hypothetical protein HELRODRAFT_167678 [Helobdella robusta]|uniref:Uncharacterized protein n=1 Tax=Helobdella robusta TaxID=6412 RepID=T1EZN7_HELRO|nr:hypothetical protein HELRODRAFT_167678 [Helobdella robusta]ESO09859.1 hypothetical protein HELRODRAFT_167678 [Helobdella robusta]